MPYRSRPYHSPLRQREANRTQQEILDAARDLFLEHGYARVTMADIARAAGTAVKTVYASVGPKTEVLHRLFAMDVAGSRAGETNAELRNAPDLESAIDMVARGTRADNENYKSSVDLMYASMASDDGARDAWQAVVRKYRAALRTAADLLVEAGFVPAHLDVDGVSDRLWFCFGLTAWRTLVVDCGWTYADTERTLRRQALAMLTEPDPGTPSETNRS